MPTVRRRANRHVVALGRAGPRHRWWDASENPHRYDFMIDMGWARLEPDVPQPTLVPTELGAQIARETAAAIRQVSAGYATCQKDCS